MFTFARFILFHSPMRLTQTAVEKCQPLGGLGCLPSRGICTLREYLQSIKVL